MKGKDFIEDVDAYFGRIYDADYIEQGSYGQFNSPEPDGPTLPDTARNFEVTHSKIRKSLITSGSYISSVSARVQEMREAGMSIPEIAEKEKLSVGSVYNYLPYEKGVYNIENCSEGAKAVRNWRELERQRKAAVEKYIATHALPDLAAALVLYSGARFKAERRFTYEVVTSSDAVTLVIGNRKYSLDDVIFSPDPYMKAIRKRMGIK